MLPGRKLTVDTAVKVLLRRRWLLIVPFFCGILGGLLYSRSQPSLYRSDAVVQVVPQRVPDAYVQATVTESVQGRLTALSQQVLSRTQLEQVILQFNLYPDERQSKPMQDVFELMTERVTVAPLAVDRRASREPDVDAFRISFDYEDPKIAQAVVEKLASFFIDRNALERGSQAEQTSAFLEAQLNDARGRLEAQEKKLEAFRERNSGRLPTHVQTNMQAIQNTQMALQAVVESIARDRDRKMMLERLHAEARADLEAASTASGPPPSVAAGETVAGAPPGATPAEQLEAARNTLAMLQLRLTPKHPDIVRTKRLIQDLEREAAAQELEKPLSPEAATAAQAVTPEEARRRDRVREMQAEIESLDRQIAFKDTEEKRLRAQMGIYQARLEAVPGVESEWVKLTRDYDTLQATYRELLAKSENSKMAASLEQRQIGEQFRVLDPPRLPEKPQSPNRIRINALGTIAGLGLGLLLIVLVESRDSTMRSEDDVLGAIELPVLVLLPYVMTDADHRRQRRRRLLVSVAAAAVCVATGALFWYLQLWKFVV